MTVDRGLNLFGQAPYARRGEAQTAAAESSAAVTMPTGAVTAYWGTIAPTGWLLCDGAAIAAEYTDLIALVGATTPNLKGRVIVGIDAAQTEFDTLGETGGAKTVTLTEANLASHNHTQNSHNHTQNIHGHGVTDPQHKHGFAGDTGSRWLGTEASPNGITASAVAQSVNIRSMDNAATGVSVNGETATNVAFTATNQAAGGDAAHNNLQPYAALSWIIKT